MKSFPTPQNEVARLAGLKRYGILGKPSDSVLDGIAQTAADVCGVQTVQISLIDSTRQSVKTCVGKVVAETSREQSFCGYAILQPNHLMVVKDALKDERFIHSPLVTGKSKIRFYAGAPLITSDEIALGTLCVVDSRPLVLSAMQMDTIRQLSKVIVDLLEQRRLQEEKMHLRDSVIEALDIGVAITDASKADDPLIYVNRGLCEMTGYTSAELIGLGIGVLQMDNQNQPDHKRLHEAQNKEKPIVASLENTRKDGSHYMADLWRGPVHNALGEVTHHIGLTRNVTEKLTIDARLRQAQKYDAIGQLSGGIAHDFNNLLCVIIGTLDFLTSSITDEARLKSLDEANKAAQMGTRLTRRLLTYAKQGCHEFDFINVNEHVLSVMELLRPTLGETIELSSQLLKDLWLIYADTSEIENTIVNLVINARDAMPDGGTILIETKNTSFAKEDNNEATGVSFGDFIELSVTDNGRGMTAEVKGRIFEPFFTTKEEGLGSGLGLAAIHEFVIQSGGHIHVDSESGCGTAIRLYLPRCDPDPRTTRKNAII